MGECDRLCVRGCVIDVREWVCMCERACERACMYVYGTCSVVHTFVVKATFVDQN